MIHFAIMAATLVLPIIRGYCHSPHVLGLVPDVIVPSVVANVRCPPPLIFDHHRCICIDPAKELARLPTQDRRNLGTPGKLRAAPLRRRLRGRRMNLSPLGLPDTPMPRRHDDYPSGRYLVRATLARGPRIVPIFHPYPSLNLPATSKMLLKKAAKAKPMNTVRNSVRGKVDEMMEKLQWQRDQKRKAAAQKMMAAQMAVLRGRLGRGPGRTTGLDGLIRRTLRRMLPGY